MDKQTRNRKKVKKNNKANGNTAYLSILTWNVSSLNSLIKYIELQTGLKSKT
jgi:hypothetical protein